MLTKNEIIVDFIAQNGEKVKQIGNGCTTQRKLKIEEGELDLRRTKQEFFRETQALIVTAYKKHKSVLNQPTRQFVDLTAEPTMEEGGDEEVSNANLIV